MAETNPTVRFISRTTPQIRIGIIGMGKMGHIHLSAIQQLVAGETEQYYKCQIDRLLPRLTVCGICDIRPLDGASYPGIPIFQDAQALLDCRQPHLVIIATPTATHPALALAAIERGVHTLVEKPIALYVADIERLQQAAAQHGARLMAGHVERYNPVSFKMRAILQNAQPPPTRYHFWRIQRHESRIPDDIVVDKLIHDLDLSLYFFGPIESVSVRHIKKVNGIVYEAAIWAKHCNGTQGEFFVSWLTETDQKTRRFEIHQGGHCWVGDLAAKQLTVDGHQIQCVVPGWIEPENNQIKDELVDFIAYCAEPLENEPAEPLLTFQEIVHATRWLEYIRQSIQTGVFQCQLKK